MTSKHRKYQNPDEHHGDQTADCTVNQDLILLHKSHVISLMDFWIIPALRRVQIME